MKYGKTIELYLVNGDSDGIVTAELSNWNGKAIKIPRIDIKESKREDLTLPGVYFLFCEDNSVYIGEAQSIKDRLVNHINDYNAGKENYYWATALCFVGNSLNKALIRYLEDRLVSIANECGNYKVLTKNTYKTVIKENEVATMEEFIDNMKILIKTMGYNVIDDSTKYEEKEILFYCKVNNANAIGYPSLNGFTVLKGSIVSDHITPSFSNNKSVIPYYNLRAKLEENRIIKNREFQKDYEFSSPSAASSVVIGNSSNGNVDWKTEKGISLKEYSLLDMNKD